jgi:asparagine synthase (glutamine-hydrolysing)
MCGINGSFAYGRGSAPVQAAALTAARDVMSSRGPDGSGIWLDRDARVGLAHRRLAILDLSDLGAQPMSTPDGQVVIVFNGEIYNFRELRQDLEARGHMFRSGSDTEVLLNLYRAEGPQMVSRLRGMYAFAIWDERRAGLFLARDPFGIKPLYYSDEAGTFRFASQVRALRVDPRVNTSPDAAGHVGFLLWGSVPEPYTLYRGIRMLPAGTSLWLDRSGLSALATHFSVRDELAHAEAEPLEPGTDSVDHLLAALSQSVGRHLVSDVPVGVFLSAGLDSGAITALAASRTASDLRTLTLGFREYTGTEDDETALAGEVARRFGCQHHVQWLTRDDYEAVRVSFPEAMDQPSLDGLNTYLVSRAAAQAGLKVALSGVGGDELLAGYPSFREVPRAVRLLRPMRAVPVIGRAARRLSSPLARWLGRPKHAGLLEYGGTHGGSYLLRRGLFMPWELGGLLDADMVREGWAGLDTLTCLEETIRGIRTPRLRVTALEMSWYMRNQLLRDTVWASMAHSVEIRVPFIDVDVFRAAARAAAANCSKAETLGRVQPPLPSAVTSRRKTGFLVPHQLWLQDELRGRGTGMRSWAQAVYEAYTSRCESG